MATQEIVETTHDARATLRNEPVQARSTARLSALLDAAAQIVDEIGYERLTTAMVAERAGASIGTVYRYFPDRIAVLQALAARNLERVLDRTIAAIHDPANETWLPAMGAASDVLVDAFRTEAGFRGLRVGDVLDLRPATTERTFNSIVADRILDAHRDQQTFGGLHATVRRNAFGATSMPWPPPACVSRSASSTVTTPNNRVPGWPTRSSRASPTSTKNTIRCGTRRNLSSPQPN